MQPPTTSDKIRLRQKKSRPGDPLGGEETILSLSAKLSELFEAGYVKDDIYGLVIPLLMQGKVRIDLEACSERLEMEDQNQRLPRSNAIQVFEDYLLVCRPQKTATSAAPAA